MRKVTETIAHALLNGEGRTVSNTSTDGESVWLHGNLIARLTNHRTELELTLAGWNTPTTRERLNGIMEVFGINSRFHQQNWEAMFDGREIAADDTICIQL